MARFDVRFDISLCDSILLSDSTLSPTTIDNALRSLLQVFNDQVLKNVYFSHVHSNLVQLIVQV